MFWFQLVVVVALLAAVGWLAVGGGGHMSEPVPDRPDLALPTDRFIDAQDLDQVRFSVGARGYRMDEVDDMLDRLAREVEVREARIAELEGRPRGSAAEGEAAHETTLGAAYIVTDEASVAAVATETGAGSADGASAEGPAAEQTLSEQPQSPDLPPLPGS